MRLLLYNGTDNFREFIVNTTTIENRVNKVPVIIKLVEKIRFKHGITYNDLFSSAYQIRKTDYNNRVRMINCNSVLKTLGNLFYNITCIDQNMPTVDAPLQRRLIKNPIWPELQRSMSTRKLTLYDAGLNPVRNSSINIFGCAKYTCIVCNVMIVGSLNVNPIIDHIAHSPGCALIRLRYNMDYIRQTVDGSNIIIVYANNVFDKQYNIYNTAMCNLCFVSKADVLCMDCAHVDMCRSCFMVMKTCGACDTHTTEFCLLNIHSNGIERITPTYMETDNVNLSDASILHESQALFTTLPCMHVFSEDNFTYCKICLTVSIGTIEFKYATRVFNNSNRLL